MIQFSTFMVNRIGEMWELLRGLMASGIHIVGFTVIDSHDFAVVRFISNLHTETRQILVGQGYKFAEEEVICVALSQGTRGLGELLRDLFAIETNIHYVYPGLVTLMNDALVILRLEDLGACILALEQKNYKLCMEADFRNLK